MILMKDFIKETDKRLRTISKEVTFPLTKAEQKLIDDMIEYLKNSQIEELSEKYDLRPGMGLSAVQIGELKRIFVVVMEKDINEFETHIMINPKMISNSEEQIYVSGGEGCLSVNREIVGITPRYARVTFEAYDRDGNKIKIRAREELAIVFQHELDHLNGKLFYDRIDKNNPFKNQENMRAI